MILDHRAVADMIAAPQIDVVARAAGRLNRLIFQNEAVLADDQIGPGDRLRANVGRQSVAGGFACANFPRAICRARDRTGPRTCRDRRRKPRLNLAPGNERQTFDVLAVDIGVIDGEADDLIGTVMIEIKARKPRHLL